MEYNRAMQAALELSMLNLNNTSYSMTSPEPPYGLLEDEVPLDSLKTKSQNITQCVSVPTSEHVAEIVGRQGCRIKALRAKTNTYIKTPVRGEEPVFIITGRPEDVSSAKREIMTAAEHFTNIRAKRASSTSNDGGNVGLSDGVRVSIMVRVPYRVVGLVVGPRGTTVKRIQQLTNTYIVTPSRDKDPAFEVRGSPDNVAKAKAEIESYIALRTGGGGDNADSPDPDGSQFCSSESYDVPSFSNPRMSESAYSYSPLDEPSVFAQDPNDSYLNVPMSAPAIPGSEQVFNFTSFNDALTYINPTLPRPNPVRVQASNREITYMPPKCQPPSPTYSCDSASSDGFSTTSPKQFVAGFNSCFVCNDEVTAALIPCGHNLFCMGCAIHIAEHTRMCPVCGSQVNNALRIRSR